MSDTAVGFDQERLAHLKTVIEEDIAKDSRCTSW